MASCFLSSPRIHSPPDSLMRRTSVTKVSGNRVFQQAVRASPRTLFEQASQMVLMAGLPQIRHTCFLVWLTVPPCSRRCHSSSGGWRRLEKSRQEVAAAPRRVLVFLVCQKHPGCVPLGYTLALWSPTSTHTQLKRDRL